MAEETPQQRAQRDADAATRAQQRTAERREARQSAEAEAREQHHHYARGHEPARERKPVIEVTINAPHTAQCRGDQLAIKIQDVPAGDSNEDLTLLMDAVFLDTDTEAFFKTNVYTDGTHTAI